MPPPPTANRHAALQTAFDRIVDLDPSQWITALEEVRAQDAALADELEALLRADAHVDEYFSPLEHPAFALEEPDPLIGTVVSHYRIESRIGSGGMGVVYRAIDERLERPVALKFLWRHLSRDPQFAQRFLIEAKAASALEHDNVGVVHELDWTEDGRAFIVMPCYDGESLAEILKKGRLAIPRAVGIALQVAEGLAAAHEAKIIHRDVKPANIWIKPDGVAKLVDFGLAKVAGSSQSAIGATPGTASYMSPEQTKGEKVTVQTDIWSLGATLYEMLTGRRAFEGRTAIEILEAVVEREPADVLSLRPEISLAVAEVVWRCMQKDTARRYPTMSDVAAALRLCVDNPTHSPLQMAGTRDPESAEALGAERTQRTTREEQPAAGLGGFQPTRRLTSRRGAWIWALLLAFGSSGVWWLWSTAAHRATNGSNRTPTLAVLPLRSYGHPDQAWMADEFAESLTADLRRSGRLHLVPYLTSLAHASRREPIRTIARNTGAEYVLDGTVRHSADSTWVCLDLWRAEGEMHLQSFQFAEPFSNRLDVGGLTRRNAAELILQHIFVPDDAKNLGERRETP